MQHPATLRTALIFLIILSATALVESSIGRTLWCACQEAVPWSWVVQSRHNSQHFIDPYTFSHILHGFVFYGLLRAAWRKAPTSSLFLLSALIESGWELLENSDFMINRYRSATFALEYYGDSIFNSLADICACGLGFVAAAVLPVRITVMLFFLIEFSMVAAIRDNLTLNVLMLIYPIEAIKTWQMG